MEITDHPALEPMPTTNCVIEGSLIISKQGPVLYASPGAACLLGYTEKDLLAVQDSQELVYAPDRFIYALWLAETRNAVDNDKQGVDMRLLHYDGSEQTFFCTFRKIPDCNTSLCLNFKNVNPLLSEDNAEKLVALYECARDISRAVRVQKDQASVLLETAVVAANSGIFDAVWISPVRPEDTDLSFWPPAPFAAAVKKRAEYAFIDDAQAKAIRTAKPAVSDEVSLTLFAPDAFTNLKGSFAALPFSVNGIVFGLVNCYHGGEHYFSPKTLQICEGITEDLSYALQLDSSKLEGISDTQKLRSSEIRLKQAQAIGSTGNFEINFRNGNATWSDEALRIYGLPLEEKEQSYGNWLSFVHPDDLDAVKKIPFNKADPYDTMFSYRIVRRDGSIRHIAIHYEYEFSESGRVSALFGTVHDITNMKAAETALLQSERNLRHIVDSVPQLIYGLDEQGLFIFVNKSFAFFYGKKPADLIGRHVTDIVPNLTESSSLLDRDPRIMTTGREGNRELELTNRKNERKTFTIVRVPYARTAKGQKAVLGVAYDISSQKKDDSERMRMIHDISSRNRDLEQFSYIVSHNLRSPVANIIGLSEELRNDGHNRKTKEMIMEKLLFSVQLLDQIIIDLNTILEIKGNHSEKKEVVHFSEVTKNITTAIHDIISAEEAVITTDFDKAPEIYTLKGYLYSILQNLISNSIKYRLHDVSPIIHIHTKKTAHSIVITYTDNGLGIDLKKRKHDVFGLYKRFHNHKPGKGLGLFMVKTQIEAMDGEISISSSPGLGTTFIITFPI